MIRFGKPLHAATTRLSLFALAVLTWISLEQSSQAQELLAQQGMAKTAVGWTLVLLCLLLGFLVVLRPNGRRYADPNDAPAPKAKKGPQMPKMGGGHGGH